MRYGRHGNPSRWENLRADPTYYQCSEEGCTDRRISKGLCGKHYQAWRKKQPKKPKLAVDWSHLIEGQEGVTIGEGGWRYYESNGPATESGISDALGRPFLDWVFDVVAEQEPLSTAVRKMLDDIGSPLTVERVMRWWYDALELDADLRQRLETERSRRAPRIEREREEAKANQALQEFERAGLLAEIRFVQSAVEGRHCVVCGAPLGDRRSTCDSECRRLWERRRYHISEEARERQVMATAKWVSRQLRPDRWAQVEYADRLLAGEPTEYKGRWVSAESAWFDLQAIEDRRAAAKERWGDLAVDLPPMAALATRVQSVTEERGRHGPSSISAGP